MVGHHLASRGQLPVSHDYTFMKDWANWVSLNYWVSSWPNFSCEFPAKVIDGGAFSRWKKITMITSMAR